jgi:hypothetical protein
MLKKIVNKRVEMFKQIFPEYETSKKGNLYYKLNPYQSEKQLPYTGFSVTKGTYKKMGQRTTYNKGECDAIFLIKPDTGKMLIKRRYLRNYKIMTLKDVRDLPVVAPTFFIGRKFEYAKDYPILWKYPLTQNFTSLKELKNFLGFDFINNKQFYSMFQEDEARDYLKLFFFAKNKSNVYNLLTNNDNHAAIFDIFHDYLTLCQSRGVEVKIPAGINKLRAYHDELVYIVNQEKLRDADKNKYFELLPIKPPKGKIFFLDYWDSIGLKYRKLESQYDMLLQGIKQNHCIGSNYSHTLHHQTFYTITHKGEEYDMQIFPDGRVGQFYGKYNRPVDSDLRRELKENPNISYIHRIMEIADSSPMEPITPMRRRLQVMGDPNDDLPF